jgi:SAM-dependent methyltransferase
MHPDVVCHAESIPFADACFDVVACRTAAHHFSDPQGAVREMARVSRDAVLLVDTLNMGEAGEQAEALRDRSHVRNYTEDEWRGMVVGAGLEIEELVVLPHTIDFPAWLERTACTGATAERVRELWGSRVEGDRLTLDKIAIRARKAA